MPHVQRLSWYWLLLVLAGAISLVVLISQWGCTLWPTPSPTVIPVPSPTPTALALPPGTRPPTPTSVTSPSPTPLPTYAVIVTSGQVRDAITGEPLAGVRLSAGFNTATTDAEGRFRIASSPDDVIRATASGYEDGQAWPQSNPPVAIRLVPDPQTTLALLHRFQRQGDYGRQYDLLHPDIQALFTRDEYVRHMQQTVDYEILSITYGPVIRLTSWTFLGRTYFDVAEVPAQMVVRQAGWQRTLDSVTHLAPVDGVWRWFRGPLEGPTATPSLTATAIPSPTLIPSPTATFQPGGYPYGTRVEVVGTDTLNLRYGPGPEHAVITSVPRGEVLVILEGPRFVGQSPWYRAQQVATGTVGWVNGNYVRPVPPPPTRTPTPTPTSTPIPPPFPIGSRVVVTSLTLNLRSGPGVAYPIVTTVPWGTILVIRSRPVYVDGWPWYLVEEEATGIQGWVNGRFVELAATPIPTASPTGTLTGTPVPTGTNTLAPTITKTSTAVPTVTQTHTPAPTATWTQTPTETSTPMPTATHTPVATATPMALGTRVEVTSPDDLNVRRGPGVGFPVVATVPPGSVLVIMDGPVYISGVPWYSVAYEGQPSLGWAEGTFLQLITA